jgi:hypothetical protein
MMAITRSITPADPRQNCTGTSTRAVTQAFRGLEAKQSERGVPFKE